MKKQIEILTLAILAGIAIGVGGIIFLSLDNKIVGACMFSVGLYAICINGLYLFTGKIGYLLDNKKDYLITLLVTWVGNLIGTGLAAIMASCTRISGISETAAAICNVKMNDGMVSLFLLGIFCGMLMFIAVDGYKQTTNPLILVLPVAVFILCGFEHCIADMFYFSMAGMWSLDAVLRVVVITIGNAVGGLMIPFVKKYVHWR